MALNSGTLHPDILTSAAETDLIPRRGDADYISGREDDGAIFASLGDDIRPKLYRLTVPMTAGGLQVHPAS